MPLSASIFAMMWAEFVSDQMTEQNLGPNGDDFNRCHGQRVSSRPIACGTLGGAVHRETTGDTSPVNCRPRTRRRHDIIAARRSSRRISGMVGARCGGAGAPNTRESAQTLRRVLPRRLARLSALPTRGADAAGRDADARRSRFDRSPASRRNRAPVDRSRTTTPGARRHSARKPRRRVPRPAASR